MENIVIFKIDDIKPYPNNPRKNDAAVGEVAKSIEKYGFQQPLVVDKNNIIVVGHTRWRAAQQLGLSHVPCVVSRLSEEENNEYRIVDNKTNELAAWDFEKLNIELSKIDLSDFNFVWGQEETEKDEPVELKEDIAPESKPDPKIQPGDLIHLGRHRLICGDSTDKNVLNCLMGGCQADLLLTDPPYNVAYEGKTKDALTIENDKMEDASFQAFLSDAFMAADSVLKPGGAFYIWHADSEGLNFRTACKKAGWRIRQCLIWAKNAIVMGRQDYHWKHEPCLYGWKDGAAHTWNSDRKKCTVLEFDKPTRNAVHPTMKPTKLFGELIQNSSRKGELVLDPFGGSGTTLVACEQLDRRARLVELDPVYCDVIVERYINLTKDETVYIERGGEKVPW